MTKDFARKFLKSAKEYGFIDRVMFGSDQMVWPEAITSSINFLNSLDFLTKEEKQMIFYKNAKKFLGLKD
jgi:predicted TIM-barrel fold metal-dependent hydrolase